MISKDETHHLVQTLTERHFQARQNAKRRGYAEAVHAEHFLSRYWQNW
jgi:hypothetical protein